jgi:hypothetical protein
MFAHREREEKGDAPRGGRLQRQSATSNETLYTEERANEDLLTSRFREGSTIVFGAAIPISPFRVVALVTECGHGLGYPAALGLDPALPSTALDWREQLPQSAEGERALRRTARL